MISIVREYKLDNWRHRQLGHIHKSKTGTFNSFVCSVGWLKFEMRYFVAAAYLMAKRSFFFTEIAWKPQRANFPL